MRFMFVLSTLLTLLVSQAALSADDAVFSLSLRSRQPAKMPWGDGHKKTTRPAKWQANQTAVIVCDMWDLHHCLNATRRGAEMAPRMNNLLKLARRQGATIIHAPSSCMNTYKDHPARKRAQAVPRSKSLPDEIAKWCYKIPSEEKGVYPIDQTDGGEDDDLAEHREWAKKLEAMGRNPRAPWKSQTDLLEISNDDYISDNGEEVWSIMEQKGLKNVIMVGVHTNMCVLGRPFGLRQMSKNGKNVVLVRDMTDTMYNPGRWPFVSHFQGTDLIVEHIEKFVCPTITSDQLLGGKSFVFKNDRRPRAVFLVAEKIYNTRSTLPVLARRLFEDRLGFQTTVLGAADGVHEIKGMAEAVKQADLVVVSVRRRALPRKDLDALKAHLAAGKPLIGLRTASHAFDARGSGPKNHAEWPEFDAKVLGGNYHNHHASGPTTTIVSRGISHPVLVGLDKSFTSKGSLYKTGPLAKGTTELLTGSIPGQKAEPIAWTNQYGKARIFYTSLGHEADFRNPQFWQLIENAVRWTSQMKNAVASRP
ncbi:MAG: nicotinamidase [Planctomycetaceae bacterium]|nr:nicotinamidase [Planctomycetaceae bacterium]|tara:strand:- start:362 stop:1963 length:1602 start_codon:yes stop_codon:yes gene_type:complete